jgi:hypothetical protein
MLRPWGEHKCVKDGEPVLAQVKRTAANRQRFTKLLLASDSCPMLLEETFENVVVVSGVPTPVQIMVFRRRWGGDTIGKK